MSKDLPAYIAQRQADIEHLAATFGVASLSLFGSAGRGDFDAARSDIDLLVVFRPMSPSEPISDFSLRSRNSLAGRSI